MRDLKGRRFCVSRRCNWTLGEVCTKYLLVVQRQRDAVIAERREQLDHHYDQIQSSETELQSEPRRTNEELKVARNERDDAIARKQLRLEQQ